MHFPTLPLFAALLAFPLAHSAPTSSKPSSAPARSASSTTLPAPIPTSFSLATSKPSSSSSASKTTTAKPSKTSSLVLPPGVTLRKCYRVSIPPQKLSPGLGKHPANCIAHVPTKDIDNIFDGLVVGTNNRWAGGMIPPALRGIFYLEGNPLKGECFSTGNAVFNKTTNSTDLLQYMPRTWSSDVGTRQLYDHLTRGSIFKTACTPDRWTGLLNCDVWQWTKKDNRVRHKGDYTATQRGLHNWDRSSNVPTADLMYNSTQSWLRYNYKMYRIVDELGQRTEWYDRYVSNINHTIGFDLQPLVSLGDYQEVSQYRP